MLLNIVVNMNIYKKFEPYYKLILDIENAFACKQTITMKYTEKAVNENYQDFRDLIKFLYVCHYCPNFDINAYQEVENYDRFVRNSNSESTVSIFHDIWQQDLELEYNQGGNFEDFIETDFIKRYIRINIEYYDENNVESDHILLDFTEEETNEIVEKIKKHGCFTSHEIHFFNKQDPEIFMKTFRTFLCDDDDDSDGEIIVIKTNDEYEFKYCSGL